MDRIQGIRNGPRRVPNVLLSGAEGGEPTARATQRAGDEGLAESFRKGQEEIVEAARERLARRAAGPERETLQQEAYESIQVEFAERAARRLESVADRLEKESGRLEGDGAALARAQELRVAAFLVRYQAVGVWKDRRDGAPRAGSG